MNVRNDGIDVVLRDHLLIRNEAYRSRSVSRREATSKCPYGGRNNRCPYGASAFAQARIWARRSRPGSKGNDG